MAWTREHIETLKALWSEGLSATQIIPRFNGEFSRNAIISKVHRLGLDKRQSPVRRNYKKKRPAAIPAVKPAPFTEHTRDDDIPAGGLQSRKDTQCCYPIGDPQTPTFGYCKAPRELGDYCQRHFLRMYPSAAVAQRRVEAPAKEVGFEVSTDRIVRRAEQEQFSEAE